MKTYRIFLFLAVVLSIAACQKPYQYIPPEVDRPGHQDLSIDGQFPIISWTGANRADAARKIPTLKGCGINTHLEWYDTIDDVLAVLDICQASGVKLITRSSSFLSNISTEVPRLMHHPALYGYHIMDEPETTDFDMLADVVKQVQAIDKEHPCYINVYPNWAWGGGKAYYAKINSFLQQVPVTFLSFDYYPIMEEDGKRILRPEWYYNLEDVRKASRARKIPFWAFALSLSHTIPGVLYPVPTVGDLRLQQFANLAYGAQAFQYFTYWGIYQGSATPVYDRVKTVNAELQSLAFIFLGADVKNVWHTGLVIPAGTKEMTVMPYGVKSLKSGDAGLIVSQVEKEGRTYIALVNKDLENNQTVTIEFNGDVVRYDHDGYKISFNKEVTLLPADITVFELK